jgi:hypothetical protein
MLIIGIISIIYGIQKQTTIEICYALLDGKSYTLTFDGIIMNSSQSIENIGEIIMANVVESQRRNSV